jgi:hypothetical protein
VLHRHSPSRTLTKGVQRCQFKTPSGYVSSDRQSPPKLVENQRREYDDAADIHVWQSRRRIPKADIQVSLPVAGFPREGASIENSALTERSYDIMPDGKRFIGVVGIGPSGSGASAAPQIQVVLNWMEELRQRVPTR